MERLEYESDLSVPDPRELLVGECRDLFAVEAVMLASAGGLAGIAAGALGVLALGRLLPDFPVHVPSWAVAGALEQISLADMSRPAEAQALPPTGLEIATLTR